MRNQERTKLINTKLSEIGADSKEKGWRGRKKITFGTMEII